MAVALTSVCESGAISRGEVILAAVSDEEGESSGARHLLRGLEADAAIVGEPTNLRLITCHRSLRPVVEIQGRAAHAAQPQDGVNAVIGAGKFLAMIEEHARSLPPSSIPSWGRRRSRRCW